jgi:hypothetical protein
MGSSRLEHSNIKFCFFGVFFYCELLFSKINVNYMGFFLSEVGLVYITINSNLNSCTLIFVGPIFKT